MIPKWNPNKKKGCARGHSGWHYLSNGFCTFIMEELCYVTKEGQTVAVMCGDVKSD